MLQLLQLLQFLAVVTVFPGPFKSNAESFTDDCPCIDSSKILLENSNCELKNGSKGVYAHLSNTIEWNCYPVTYGSDVCDTHDKKSDPRCEGKNPPGYCQTPWCYVDAKLCRQSPEAYFKTNFFDPLELYYSYSTCNSTVDEWARFFSVVQLQERDISVSMPTAAYFPRHYKLNSSGGVPEQFSDIDEYYNDSIVWKGWMIDYFNAVVEVSNLGKISYTYRSGGSDEESPNSTWTASIHDVQARISCISASNFWITPERLKYTMFTVPLSYDKVYLYIKSPEGLEKNTFLDNVKKVLSPFSIGLWIVIIIVFFILALLSLVFANKKGEMRRYFEKARSKEWKEASILQRAFMSLRMYYDSSLLVSTRAMSHAVDVNVNDSLAQKTLNFGIAFWVLVLIAAYTANLAAFLTVSFADSRDYLKDMDDAIAKGITICCAWTPLEDQLSRKWPNAKIIYPTDYMEAYDRGNCSAIIQGEPEVLDSNSEMTKFCERNLVKAGPVPLLEIPVAFPICSDLAAGMSHWILEAEKKGISYNIFLEANRIEEMCSFEIKSEDDNDLAKLTIEDFTLPWLVLLFSAVTAILIHLGVWNTERKASAKNTSVQISSKTLKLDPRHNSSVENVDESTGEANKMKELEKILNETNLNEMKELLERLQVVASKDKNHDVCPTSPTNREEVEDQKEDDRLDNEQHSSAPFSSEYFSKEFDDACPTSREIVKD